MLTEIPHGQGIKKYIYVKPGGPGLVQNFSKTRHYRPGHRLIFFPHMGIQNFFGKVIYLVYKD